MAKQQFHKGDKVTWSSGQGVSSGTVEEYVSEARKIGAKTIAASHANPRYLVKNDRTGSITARKPDALSKASSRSGSGKSGFNKSDAHAANKQPAEEVNNSEKGSSEKGGSEKGDLEKGDRVQWKTRQGKTTGRVQKKITSQTNIKGYTAKASEDEPQYLVKSDRTGSEAAHKPDALEPLE